MRRPRLGLFRSRIEIFSTESYSDDNAVTRTREIRVLVGNAYVTPMGGDSPRDDGTDISVSRAAYRVVIRARETTKDLVEKNFLMRFRGKIYKILRVIRPFYDDILEMHCAFLGGGLEEPVGAGGVPLASTDPVNIAVADTRHAFEATISTGRDQDGNRTEEPAASERNSEPTPP